MRLKRRLQGFYSLSKSSVSIILAAGLLGGCSSDFSRFTDGISKSSAPKHKVYNEPFDAYPPAPRNNAANAARGGKVESNALPPVSPAEGQAEMGEAASSRRGAPPQSLGQLPEHKERAFAEAEQENKRHKILYTVVAGDNLTRIAARHKVSVASIKRENSLSGDKILIGQKLAIIGGAASAAAVKPAEPKTAAKAQPVPAPEAFAALPPAHEGAAPAKKDAPENEQGAGEKAAPALEAGKIAPAAHKTEAAKTEMAKKEAAETAAALPPAQEKSAEAAAKDKQAKAESADKSKSAAGAGAAEQVSSAPMIWPVKGNIISSYGERTGTSTNDGIDIAVPEGTSVKAAEGGVVIYAGDGLKEFGNTILIRHDDNIVTVYGHNSKLLAQRGKQVRKGEEIAQSGSSGNASVAKLHFEVRKNSAPVNPMKYLPSVH